jgi:hypothetical protein
MDMANSTQSEDPELVSGKERPHEEQNIAALWQAESGDKVAKSAASLIRATL